MSKTAKFCDSSSDKMHKIYKKYENQDTLRNFHGSSSLKRSGSTSSQKRYIQRF